MAKLNSNFQQNTQRRRKIITIVAIYKCYKCSAN